MDVRVPELFEHTCVCVLISCIYTCSQAHLNTEALICTTHLGANQVSDILITSMAPKQYSVVLISDVQYIDFISISRYFCSYRTVSKSILHLLTLDNYRTAEFSNIYINLSKGIATEYVDI